MTPSPILSGQKILVVEDEWMIAQHLSMLLEDMTCEVVGPVATKMQLEKDESMVQRAVKEGAAVLCGGRRPQMAEFPNGYFYEPTIVHQAAKDSFLMKNEVFGPVLAVTPFKDDAEALALANDTEFGLAAYFYGRDVGRIWRVAEALEYGIVGINTGIISTEVAPFGGVKESGLGREGSKYGLEEFLEIKYLCLGGI